MLEFLSNGADYFYKKPEPGDILFRNHDQLSLKYKYRIFKFNFINVDIVIGSSYRRSGYSYVVRIPPSHPWELIMDAQSTNGLGLLAGTSLKFKVYKRFSLGILGDFSHYPFKVKRTPTNISKISKNQFIVSMFLGYDF